MSKILQKNQYYKKYTIDSKLKYFKPHATKIEKSFADEIITSMSQDLKSINPKFFYDKKGSELFEKICKLQEYYLTRVETEILEKIQHELSLYLDESFQLVELGSGASVKTRLILNVLTKLQKKTNYLPIDISEILTESSQLLLNDYESLNITGIIDTYDGGLEFLEKYNEKKNLIIFLGSSYGNFLPNDGRNFLKKINSIIKKDDLFLIGLDLVKAKSVLEQAYNDAQGITARFNLNILSRINDELDADFNLDDFAHYCTYDKVKQRIEIYLKSLTNQTITISKSNLLVNLKKNELIHTEYSHKYTTEQIHNLLNDAGFKIRHMWTDDAKYFSLTLASKI